MALTRASGCTIIGSLIEVYRGILVLLANGSESNAPMLARTMLESFADLMALSMDPAYAQRMKAHAAIERKRVVEEYVAKYQAMPGFEATAERARGELGNLDRIIQRPRRRSPSAPVYR